MGAGISADWLSYLSKPRVMVFSISIFKNQALKFLNVFIEYNYDVCNKSELIVKKLREEDRGTEPEWSD